MGKNIYTKEHQRIINKLIKARLEVGMTQVQVARKMKRHQSYISKIETGQVEITVVMLKRLARIYEKDIGYFV